MKTEGTVLQISKTGELYFIPLNPSHVTGSSRGNESLGNTVMHKVSPTSPPKVWLPTPPLYENYLATITYNLHVAKPPGHFSGLISLGIQQHLKQMTAPSSAS